MTPRCDSSSAIRRETVAGERRNLLPAREKLPERAAATSKAKIKEGGEDAKAEIEKLQKAFDELDKRSKLILKLILVLSGLDIFLAL